MTVSTEDLSFRPLGAENRLFHLGTFKVLWKTVLLMIVLVLLYTDRSSTDFENRTAKKLYTNCQKHQSNLSYQTATFFTAREDWENIYNAKLPD